MNKWKYTTELQAELCWRLERMSNGENWSPSPNGQSPSPDRLESESCKTGLSPTSLMYIYIYIYINIKNQNLLNTRMFYSLHSYAPLTTQCATLLNSSNKHRPTMASLHDTLSNSYQITQRAEWWSAVSAPLKHFCEYCALYKIKDWLIDWWWWRRETWFTELLN